MSRTFIHRRAVLTALLASIAVAAATGPSLAQNDPLPSWNDGPAKKAITDFVMKVTRDGGSDFVPEPQRIAVFDNDGTLWSEQPMYVQLAFVVDRIKAMSNQHPEWKDKQPYKAVLENDIEALAKSGEKGLLELVMATHPASARKNSPKSQPTGSRRRSTPRRAGPIPK